MWRMCWRRTREAGGGLGEESGDAPGDARQPRAEESKECASALLLLADPACLPLFSPGPSVPLLTAGKSSEGKTEHRLQV